ncbi:MAG: 2-oxoglutarate dehydrogenase complex dihydrolipoyllysine-residue succinyltransferase [Parvularculaceae bacterium]
MTAEIRVPTLGESVTEATVGRWLKKVGDNVSVDEPLVELETDKVSVEVPAPSAGVISSIEADEGATVEVGALLGAIGEGAAKTPAKSAAKKAATSKKETKSSANGAAAKNIEVRVPMAGESVTEAQIGEWMKQEGDAVAADEPIVMLETDKASMDVVAPAAGVIKKIAAKAGDTVEVGELLALIAPGGETAPSKIKLNNRPEAPSEMDATLSPAPRRVLAEAGVDPASVQGTGKDGRITKGDALAAASAPKAKAPERPRAPKELGPREERVKMSRLRQTIARRLKEAQDNAAMLTTFNDVDMSAVMALRTQYKELFEKKHGVKLGFMSFFVKACVHALKEIPDVNAEIDGTDIIYKNHYDVGIAVGTDRGLVVPVLRDADALSLADIEKSIGDFGRRARDGALTLEEMQGGTFTITNGGVYGSLMSTPILNPPQSGVLGMHRIEERPIAKDGAVVIRPMMYLALSYDHRIVDGKGAVTFLVRVKENLEDPQRLMLDL